MNPVHSESPMGSFWGRWCGLDLKNCDLEIISDRQAIEKYILSLCALLNFTRFGNPTIVRFGNRPEITGYSFTQLIETSLVSGHLVEANRCAFIDIFSCCEYSVETARNFTREYFRAEECLIHSIDRLSS